MGCHYSPSSLTQWVETDLKEIGWEGVERIHLAEDRA
jgi:hypothetical protein